MLCCIMLCCDMLYNVSCCTMLLCYVLLCYVITKLILGGTAFPQRSVSRKVLAGALGHNGHQMPG